MGPCEEVGRNPSPISLSGMGVMARQLSSRSLVPNKWLPARTKHCCCSPYPGRMHPAGPSESFSIPHFICLKERLICDVICLRGFSYLRHMLIRARLDKQFTNCCSKFLMRHNYFFLSSRPGLASDRQQSLYADSPLGEWWGILRSTIGSTTKVSSTGAATFSDTARAMFAPFMRIFRLLSALGVAHCNGSLDGLRGN